MHGGKMSSRLERITDWEILAKECTFSAKKMAERCGISTRQLRWYFQEYRGFALKKWLDDLRVEVAAEMLEKGEPVKSIAVDLGFKQRSHFSKFFKRVTGIAPSDQWRYARQSDSMSTRPLAMYPRDIAK
jgi:AraC-like DNA-binding protein